MAQADRSDPPGEAARTAQRRLAVRLQLRSPQPDAPAQANRPKSGARPQGAVRLKFDRRAETAFHEPPKPAETLAKYAFRAEIDRDTAENTKPHPPITRISTSS